MKSQIHWFGKSRKLDYKELESVSPKVETRKDSLGVGSGVGPVKTPLDEVEPSEFEVVR